MPYVRDPDIPVNYQLGNCGAQSQDSDFIVALSTAEYNNGAHCWQHIKVSCRSQPSCNKNSLIHLGYLDGGKTIDATVVDSCPGCSQYSIDLSPGAFQALASLDAGRIPVTWWYA